MNNNMNKRTTLESAVTRIKWSLQNSVMSGMFSQGKITSAKLTTAGHPIIGVEVTEIIELTPYTKRLEYSVVNGSVFETLPMHGLCDATG
jgi:hypothetical protein